MPWKRLILATLLAAVAWGCSDDASDEPDAGGPDAGVDSGPRDSGPRDSGARDAAVTDAGKQPATDAETDAASKPNCGQVPSWVEPGLTGVQVSSLAVLCARFRCAARIEDAIQRAVGTGCDPGILERGCGVTTVRGTWEIHYYATDSGELIGAGFGSDIFFNFALEGCEAAFFQAGEAAGPCPTRSVEDFCDDAGAQDAGS